MSEYRVIERNLREEKRKKKGEKEKEKEGEKLNCHIDTLDEISSSNT